MFRLDVRRRLYTSELRNYKSRTFSLFAAPSCRAPQDHQASLHQSGHHQSGSVLARRPMQREARAVRLELARAEGSVAGSGKPAE